MSSKVYDKPDRSVAILWECESATMGLCLVFKDGSLANVRDNCIGWHGHPQEHHGRWRPYIANTPEPWPPRKLMPRRCWATVEGKRRLLIWTPSKNTSLFHATDEYLQSYWYAEADLTNIHWLDPEQEAVEVP